MKLDDIDILLSARRDFMVTRDMLKLLRDPKYSLGVKIGGCEIVAQPNQTHPFAPQLRKAILEVLERFDKEYITKLMALGVTEFPE
jgi:hypothetical protein